MAFEDDYPLHKKLSENAEARDTIQHFIDKLDEEGVYLTKLNEEGETVYVTPEKAIGLYFDIDPGEFEKEKDRLYKALVSSIEEE